MGWVASQNGIPENRIVRFLAGVGGYICELRFSLSSLLAANSTPFRIPFPLGAFKAFLGAYSSLGVSPQLQSAAVIASATRDSARGYFRNGNFAAYASNGSAQIGAFEHQYTDGEPARRILRIDANGRIYDGDSGVEVTRSGSFIASPTNLTYTVSADGRLLIAESDPTTGPVRVVRKCEIDWPTDSAAWSTISEATPYGEATQRDVIDISVTGTSGEYSGTASQATTVTRAATYPMTYGLSAAPDVQSIEVSESYLLERSTEEEDAFSGGVGGYSFEISTEATARVTITLPDATSGTFEASYPGPTPADSRSVSQNEAQEHTSPTVGISGSENVEVELGVLGIIYADASVPILFYEHRRTESSYSSEYSGTVDVELVPVPRATTDGAVTFTREVGVLANGERRVLFTESRGVAGVEWSGPDDGLAGVAVQQYGFPTAVIGGGYSGPGSLGETVPFEEHTDNTVASDITVNKYFKKLKWVTDTKAAGFITNLNGGVCFMRDVLNLTGEFANEHRYWISVRDKERWMLGVQRVRDMEGGTINDMQLYSGAGGGWEDGMMRQKYFDYLIAQAQAAAVPDEDLIATLQGGGFGSYDGAFGFVSRIPLI